MSARTLAVIAAVLVAAPAAYADFTSEVHFSADGGATLQTAVEVAENSDLSALPLTVVADITYTDPGAHGINGLQLNFTPTDATLGINGAVWQWSDAVLNNMDGVAGPFPDDSLASDGFVARMSPTGTVWVTGDGVVELGTLTLSGMAPAYDAGGDNTYRIDFTEQGTNPTLVGGTEGASDLTPSGLDINVTPEPATMALLGMGGAALLLRRRRR